MIPTEENRKIRHPHAVNNSINAISGAYTGPLIDCLYAVGQRAENKEDLYHALNTLYELDCAEEAMRLIRGLFAIAGMEYPYPIAVLDSLKQAREVFVSEFLCDLYEIIEEKRMEEKRE
ncbi:hypothetical protein [Blautia marasmi]|uniref:hypothetical protein n=1 Tax=Blautia marasmi TaxID=1917868 RepID=UPI0025931031|nr:hypothetical protein [uncultured Blautia sp.]